MITVSLPSLSTPPSERLLLVIPLEKIQSLCFHPAKWLRFVGWTIFHVPEGYLSSDLDGNDRLTDESQLTDEEFIFYQAPGFNQSAVVDMHVAAPRRTASCTSATTANQRDTDFWEKIQRRDKMCVFTSWDGQACHIIPHSHGDQIQMLSEERSILPSIQDIGDLRNGITLFGPLHGLFDKRLIAVLVTPNPILSQEDVPHTDHPCNPRDPRPPLLNMRYTLQIINLDDNNLHLLERNYAHNNRDAKFKDATPTSLPEASLLHYLYGAAIVTAFGRSTVAAWQASGKWRTPQKQSYPATKSFNTCTLENRSLTQAKREGTSPYPSESKSAGGPRITANEALDYMFNITLRQRAYREQARWAQRKLEIDAWVSGCTEGNPGQ